MAGQRPVHRRATGQRLDALGGQPVQDGARSPPGCARSAPPPAPRPPAASDGRTRRPSAVSVVPRSAPRFAGDHRGRSTSPTSATLVSGGCVSASWATAWKATSSTPCWPPSPIPRPPSCWRHGRGVWCLKSAPTSTPLSPTSATSPAAGVEVRSPGWSGRRHGRASPLGHRPCATASEFSACPPSTPATSSGAGTRWDWLAAEPSSRPCSSASRCTGHHHGLRPGPDQVRLAEPPSGGGAPRYGTTLTSTISGDAH